MWCVVAVSFGLVVGGVMVRLETKDMPYIYLRNQAFLTWHPNRGVMVEVVWRVWRCGFHLSCSWMLRRPHESISQTAM